MAGVAPIGAGRQQARCMQLLIFNAGSSSLKFDLMGVSASGQIRRLRAGAFVDTGDGSGLLQLRAAADVSPPSPAIRTLADAAGFVLDWLSNASLSGSDLSAGVDATVHRIVHGGDAFRTATRLGELELAALAELAVLAPLHNPPALSVIATVRQRLDPMLPLIGAFDTAYFAELPEVAYRYAVPARWREEFGVRRYGFHGIAHRYLCQTTRARLRGSCEATRIVSLQLGRGCSVTATIGNRVIAT